jgi:nicotinate-nucleotide--dimethylbenzimidazole phosphoribosyltransferase
MMARKAEAVDHALALHAGNLKDPFEALRRVGGREFAAIAGAILAARVQRIPVILDGLAATAAAAVLVKARPDSLDHCLLSHLSTEPGHRRLVELLGLEPLADLRLAHGEGVGGGIAAGMVKAAALVYSGLAAANRN